MNERQVVRIEEVASESEEIRTLRFKCDGHFIPGQFVMVWIPGVDEIPMSLSYLGDTKGITVKPIGEATEALASLGPGDKVGLRGPFGRGFAISEQRTLCVGGGVGVATMMPVVTSFKDRGLVEIAIGALSEAELIFEERSMNNANRVHTSTNDGTKGFHGTVVDMVKPLISSGDFRMVIGCGPEKMLSSLVEVCRKCNVQCQMSLERYMKCGVGLCGSCAMNGKRVCADGPVFFGDELDGLNEFGRCKRDRSGRKVDL
jgi:dihydroorotate dehydrogenase electron transfer subunit